ncbi:hypothetical protein SteCoe_509 [Stentor coeruleus]|uniref:Ion transport domain-containing protein n=1 Tax=Stentor coeruleus TaxID=5963 RepID=A0A1R2D3W3_9CILI|nr:hypothetical protein SteCoe_509 [Stentor coeruleus]
MSFAPFLEESKLENQDFKRSENLELTETKPFKEESYILTKQEQESADSQNTQQPHLIEMQKLLRTIQLLKDIDIINEDKTIILSKKVDKICCPHFSLSSDSLFAVLSCEENSIAVFDLLKNTQNKFILGYHESKVTSIIFSSSDWLLASSDENGVIKIWENVSEYNKFLDLPCNKKDCEKRKSKEEPCKSFECRGLQCKTFQAHESKILCLAISSDLNMIASGSIDNNAKLWISSDYKNYHIFQGHNKAVNAIAFTNNNKNLVTGSEDKSLIIWGIKKRILLFILRNHKEPINNIIIDRFSFGQGIASISRNELRIWNLNNKKTEFTYTTEDNEISSISMDSDKNYLALGFSFGKRIEIISLENYKIISSFDKSDSCIENIKFSSDGKYFAILNAKKLIIHSLRHSELSVLITHNKKVTSIAINRSGKIIGSISEDCTFKSKSWKKPEEMICELKLKVQIKCLSFANTPENINLVCLGLEDGSIMVKNITTHFENKVIKICEKAITFISFCNKDKSFLYTEANSSQIYLISDSLADNSKNKLVGHNDTVLCVAYDGNKFAISGSKDKSVIIWDISLMKMKKKINMHLDWVCTVCISNNGKIAASGSRDKNIIIFNLVLMKSEYIINNSRIISSLYFSYDLKYIVSTSDDNQFKVWNLQEQCLDYSITGHSDTVNIAVFGSDSNFIISGSNDKTIKVWGLEKDIEDQKTIIKLKNEKIPIKKIIPCPKRKYALLVDDNGARVLSSKGAITSYFKNYDLSEWNIGFSINSNVIFQRENNIHCYNPKNGMKIDITEEMVKTEELLEHRFYDLGNQSYIGKTTLISCLKTKDSDNIPIDALDSIIGKSKFTGLHIIAYKGEYSIIKTLIGNQIISLKTDNFGYSPLRYAIEKRHQTCVDVLIQYIIYLSTLENQGYLQSSILALRNDLNIIIENSSIYLQQFFNLFLIRETKIRLIKPLKSLPIVNLSDTKISLINSFASLNDDDIEKKVPVTIVVSIIPINTSEKALLDAIINYKNENIFRSDFIQYIIEYNWNDMRLFILITTFLEWIFLSFIFLAIGIFSGDNSNLNIAILILNILLIFLEIFQIYNEPKTYFLNLWNFADIFRVATTFSYFCVLQSDVIIPTKYTWLMLFSNLLRGTSGFRAFSKTRYYVRLLISSLSDIKWFIVLYFYTVFCFGFLTITLQGKTADFQNIIFNPVIFSVGEFSVSEADLSFTVEISIMLAITINVILMLNMIISILGNSFSEFQEKADIYNYCEMAEVILENYCIKRMFTKSKNEKKYLQVCDLLNEGDSSSGINDQTDQFIEINKRLTRLANIIDEKKNISEANGRKIEENSREIASLKEMMREFFENK